MELYSAWHACGWVSREPGRQAKQGGGGIMPRREMDPLAGKTANTPRLEPCMNVTTTDSRTGQTRTGADMGHLHRFLDRRVRDFDVAKPSVEEPDAAEPARPDLWGARVSNDPGLPDHSRPSIQGIRNHQGLAADPRVPTATRPSWARTVFFLALSLRVPDSLATILSDAVFFLPADLADALFFAAWIPASCAPPPLGSWSASC